MIRFVFKPRRKVRGKKVTARLYSGRYRLEGEGKFTEVRLKTTDKQVADKRLNQIVSEKERECAGIISPKHMRDSGVAPMGNHLGDFLQNLKTLGRDNDYIKNLRYRINILLRECGWDYPSNISGNSFEIWRARQKKAPKTLNQYLDSINALLNWMVQNGRIGSSPLRQVKKVQFYAVRKRRAFSADEVRALLEVAGESRIGYLLAIHTGLRRGELKELRWGNIDLEAEAPFLRLDGEFTKNKSDAYIPLHPEIIGALRAIRPAGAISSDHVLVNKMLPSMWKMKSDLKRAGIVFEQDGRRLDFHSLRHTLATNLASSDVPPRVAMAIMRHSDIRLTMNNYTDASRLPLATAINSLPSFCAVTAGSAAKNNYAQIRTQTLGSASPDQSLGGTTGFCGGSIKLLGTEGLWHDLALSDVVGEDVANGCLARTRT
jgi:integrase